MTKCFSESQIEQHALDILAHPGLPVPSHIMECGFCSTIYAQFTEFYTQTRQELNKIDQSTRVAVINQKFQSDATNVYWFDALHLVQSVKLKPHYTKILAADSEISMAAQTIHNVGVFTSGDERLMVRILKNTENDYSLFLLSDSKELYQNVLVRIVGFDCDFVSDMNGHIELGKLDLPDPEKLGIEVRTTTETHDLRNYFPSVGSFLGETEISVEHSDDRHFKMEIFSVEGKFNLKVTISETAQANGHDHVKIMVVKNENHTEVQDTVQGVVLFEDIQDPADLQLKIFA